jgi:hypothetical protein
MFNPSLDSGSDWVDVNRFSVQPERFNYQHYFDLSFRSDALLIKITTTVANVEYKFGGEVFQFWEVGANRYQTRYSKVWFNNQTVVAIEPLANSRLLYRPPTYLYNWTLDVKARPYEPLSTGSVDFSEVTELIRSGFEANRTDLGEIAANNVEERLQILTQINQLDAGIYALSEGLADLLPQERGDEIRQNTRTRLNLDMGFL